MFDGYNTMADWKLLEKVHRGEISLKEAREMMLHKIFSIPGLFNQRRVVVIFDSADKISYALITRETRGKRPQKTVEIVYAYNADNWIREEIIRHDPARESIVVTLDKELSGALKGMGVGVCEPGDVLHRCK